MNFVQFQKHLRTKSPRRFWLIYGEDVFQKYYAECKLLKKFSEYESKFILDGKYNKWSEVIDCIFEDSFFVDKKFIVIRNYDKFSTDKSEIYKFIEKNPVDTVLILSLNSKFKPEGTPLFKETSGEIFCRRPRAESNFIFNWILNELEDKNIVLSEELIKLISESYATNLSGAMNILNQIDFFKDEDSKVDESLFKELLFSIKEFDYFDLLFSVVRRDRDKALQILFSMLDSKRHRDFILFTVKSLSEFFKLLFDFKNLPKTCISLRDAANEIGINRYLYEVLVDYTDLSSKSIRNMDRWDTSRIDTALNILSDISLNHLSYNLTKPEIIYSFYNLLS